MHSDFQTGQIYTKGSGHLKCQFGCGVLSLGVQKIFNFTNWANLHQEFWSLKVTIRLQSFKFGGTKFSQIFAFLQENDLHDITTSNMFDNFHLLNTLFSKIRPNFSLPSQHFMVLLSNYFCPKKTRLSTLTKNRKSFKVFL